MPGLTLAFLRYGVELVDVRAACCEVHDVVAQHLLHLLQLRLHRLLAVALDRQWALTA